MVFKISIFAVFTVASISLLAGIISLSTAAYADSVIATIPVGTSPESIVFDSSNDKLFESNAGSGTVLVINGTTNMVVNTIPVNAPTGMAFDSLNGFVYVAQELVSGTVTVINGAIDTIVGSPIPVGSSPIHVVFDSTNGDLYVSAEASNSVSVINGSSNIVIGSPIPVGSTPVEMTFDSANGEVYVDNFFDNTVSVINGATNTVITTIPVGVHPFGAGFDPANGYVYISNTGSNTVSVINGTTNTVVNTIPVGVGPVGIAFDSANDNLYVTDETANTVSVINGTTNTVVNTIPVGAAPFDATFDSANNNVYVTNDGDNTVSVISTTSSEDTSPAVLGSITAPTSPVQVNTQITASDSFTDGSDDTHTASWNWGDNTTNTGTVTESGGSGSVQNTHTYNTPGVYTITLTVNSSDGTSASAQFQFLVVYDPDGGFVTGGGWINSPQGAYASNPSLTGKATFGFNSKYQHGATVPTGNTMFEFKAANLDFKSTSYDWLVIAGAKAQYKGTGTINGAGSYHFILTAIDGEANGGGNVDKFRMKLTDSNDGLIYDNLLNAPDSGDPTTVLGGGDIIIHRG